MDRHERSLTLTNAPLQYAPRNELGVVFLFAHVAPRHQLRIEQIRPSFPDCIAFRRSGNSEKLVRIEFEYRSSNFKSHGHDARKCDCIVCWHHDWPEVPKRLEVIELKREFRVGPKIWIQPAIENQCHYLDECDETDWALSKQATVGDLLLMYRCAPYKCISDIFIVAGELEKAKAEWRKGYCYHASIRRLCHLVRPITLDEMRAHRSLKQSAFVRRNMQGNHLVSEYWHHLHRLIIQHNPRVARVLECFAPERL